MPILMKPCIWGTRRRNDRSLEEVSFFLPDQEYTVTCGDDSNPDQVTWELKKIIESRQQVIFSSFVSEVFNLIVN